MAKNLDRRSFLKVDVGSHKRISHIDPQWPTPEMALLQQKEMEHEPFIFLLDPPKNSPKILNVTSSLARLSESSWNQEKAAHLLKRAHGGAAFSDIQHYTNIGLDATVSDLLKIRNKPEKPADWVEELIPDFRNMTDSQRQEYQTLYRDRRIALVEWWINLMMKDDMSIRENMTLFWHEHFATNAQKVYFPQAVFEQNDVIREYGLGNFKTLLRKISFGPAMMIWLDSRRSKKNAPNENFPRELMELFSMGVDTYSQEDVVAASRAFTGYSTDGYLTNYLFDDRIGTGEYWDDNHDFDQKTFLGETGNFNGDNIIDIILEQDAVAHFICEKMYKWFIYEIPDEIFVDKMAAIFRDGNYEIKPVMEYLLTSEHFYDDNFRGAHIPNPTTQSLGLIRKLNLHHHIFPDRWLMRYIEYMGMAVLYPPDVNGWTGHRAWINSITLPIRKLLAATLVDEKVGDNRIKFEANVVEIANGMSNSQNARQLIKDFALVFFGLPLSEKLENKLVETLMDGAAEYDWDIDAAGSNSRLRELVKYMLRLPEAQLA
ncbi:MAG: DUF1800 domain-containing protein [Candidatus Marinimicrobia bacterium]|nr:DUF1800 domain-containing protein [Candidatus Neomarinimicrobiota bacterium]MBL7010199.1 DUF1800 domain-containing protein [Candidatus Neomarinimicrobiota bacterium]MBL7030612.1 DUF1800 domain-containing protein [Candidatus Neomarinimicrobiota bacterium]